MAPFPGYPGGGRFSSALLLSLLLFSSLSSVQGDCSHLSVPNAILRSGDPKDSYPVGTLLQYRCVPGYEPIPGETLSVTCLDTSKWSIEKPQFCRGRQCPTISFENGRIIKSTDLRLGDEITLGCNDGYRLVGQNTLRCMLVGNKVDWSRELPLCQRIPCFPPPDIPNGKHTGSGLHEFDYGTAVTYTCNRPYSLVGSQTIFCKTAADGINGEWRPAAPECKVISCHRPNIENGGLTTTFRPSYDYGNLITFICNAGYTLVGSDNSRCGADSKWHPPLPQCLKGIFTTTVVTTVTTPGNTTAPNHSPGVVIGSVVAVLLGLCLIAAGWKYRSCFIKGKTEPSSNVAESYRAVATDTEIGLEPKAS